MARIALFLCGILLNTAARAADPESAPIAVVLHSESAELSFDAVAQALSEQLRVRTVAADTGGTAPGGTLTVTYHPQSKELVVSFSDAVRGTVTRVVPAPERVTEVPGVAALVAENLVRDQASEFLKAPQAVEPVPAPLAAPPAPLPVSPSELPPPDPPPPPPHRFGNAALFYPLATNRNAPELETNFDFNLLYGHIGALDGLELGTVSTVTGNAQGLQLALLMNLVGGQVHAGQFSTLYNRGGSVEGIQVAIVNRSDEAMQGLQLGAVNLAGSLSQGLQLSGANFAGNLEGVQLGLINVAKRVRGVQLGLINIADDVDGVPIGLISVTKTGGVHPVVWSSNTTYANLGVKFSTRYTYTMLSGAEHYDGGHHLYGAGLTIGASIPVAKQISAEIDVQALHLFADASCKRLPASLRNYYPHPEDPLDSIPNGVCNQNLVLVDVNGNGYYPVATGGFTSADSRAYDQSLGKLRALLRFAPLAHLSFFVGAGVTGQVTYPIVNGDTQVQFRLLSEFFGGVQL